MPIKVSQIMAKSPKLFHVPSMTEDLVKFMIKNKITGTPIIDQEGWYVGMVSRRDIFSNPSEIQTAMLMRKAETVSPDDDIKKAARMMVSGGRRHIAVVDAAGKVAGILTPHSFLPIIQKEYADVKVSRVMKKSSFALWEKMPARLFIKMADLAQKYAFPVLDADGNFRGILTDRDVFNIVRFKSSESSMKGELSEDDPWSWEGVRNFTSYAVYKNILTIPDITVESCMISDPRAVDAEEVLGVAAKIMLENDFNQLPVLTGSKGLLGMLYDIDMIEVIS